MDLVDDDDLVARVDRLVLHRLPERPDLVDARGLDAPSISRGRRWPGLREWKRQNSQGGSVFPAGVVFFPDLAGNWSSAALAVQRFGQDAATVVLPVPLTPENR